jgi:demethylmenaquinone methyltransferase / 2-methoxy-6-polyprenyl-1,4-benzoquinol methylase
MDEAGETTHFGYTEVPAAQKAARVRAVFDSVAPRYDLMNDLMSGGLHRLWKRFAVDLTAPRPGEQVLDLAGGTGDLARLIAPRVAPGGRVIVADINAAMLGRGRDRLLDAGMAGALDWVQCDAQRLPFADRAVDCVTIGFGLRNVTDQAAALAEIHRVLRPGGRALVLEFSRPALAPLRPLYDRYSFSVLPRLGRWVAGDEDAYRYLAESIRRHPDQATLLAMMQDAGFARCRYYNLAAGIVAIHRGWRL